MEQSKKEINGNTYLVKPLPARKGISTLTMLIKLVGPAFSSGDGTDDKRVTKAFGEILNGLEAQQVLDIADLFGGCTIVTRKDGTQIALSGGEMFDSHFAAKYAEMVEWLAFCLEVNFSDFLGSIGFDGSNFRETLKTQQGKPSPSPETLIG